MSFGTKPTITPGMTRCYLGESPPPTTASTKKTKRTKFHDCGDDDTGAGADDALGRQVAYEPTLAYTPVVSSLRLVGRRRFLSSDGVNELNRKLENLFLGGEGAADGEGDDDDSLNKKEGTSRKDTTRKRVTLGSIFYKEDGHGKSSGV